MHAWATPEPASMQGPLGFSIPHNHPSLAGRFPDGPSCPGVVVLDIAIALILGDRPASTWPAWMR